MPPTIRLCCLFLILALLTTGYAPVPARPATLWQSKVDLRVLDTNLQVETEFIILMAEQADLSGTAKLSTKFEKGRFVFEKLIETARRTQPSVLKQLDSMGAEVRSYWVVNAVWARGGQGVIQAMAERPDVAHIYANPLVKLDEPVAVPNLTPSLTPAGIEWNLTQVNAPQVWAVGVTGQGVVIAGADTGYAWDHPALKSRYRGWDGSNVDHDYNWHDATPSANPDYSPTTPVDPHGHGTHTMGIMVGDDGAGNQIGMAPGAQWIGCRNMDSGGYGTPASYTECFEWLLAPYPVGGTSAQGDPTKAPDVVNNSWGCTVGEGCDNPTAIGLIQTAVDNLRAAGIVVVASAGNYGSGCGSVNYPPAIYGASLTVGSTDSGDIIASGSSRGPADYTGLPKPNVSAPGVNVRSSIPNSPYYTPLSGTSMAAPHVAGLVALLLSAQPALRGHPDEIQNLIEQTAVRRVDTTCGGDPSGIPNNVYGWGRIDAWAAVQNVPHSLNVKKQASAPAIEAGDTLTYTIAVTHTHPVSLTYHVVLTNIIPTSTVFITATLPFTRTGDLIEWDFDSLGAGDSLSVTLVVGVPITTTGVIPHTSYSVRSDEVPPVSGPPVVTIVYFKLFLPLIISNFEVGPP